MADVWYGVFRDEECVAAFAEAAAASRWRRVECGKAGRVLPVRRPARVADPDAVMAEAEVSAPTPEPEVSPPAPPATVGAGPEPATPVEPTPERPRGRRG